MSYIEQPLQGLGADAGLPQGGQQPGAGLARNVGTFPPAEWKEESPKCKALPDGRLVTERHATYVGGPKVGLEPDALQAQGCVPSGRGGEFLGLQVPYWCCHPPVGVHPLPAPVGSRPGQVPWWLGLLLGGAIGYFGYKWLKGRHARELQANPKEAQWDLRGGGSVHLTKAPGMSQTWDVDYSYEGGPWAPVGYVKYYPDSGRWSGVVGDEIGGFGDLDEAVAFVVREGGFQQKTGEPGPPFAMPERNVRWPAGVRSERLRGDKRDPAHYLMFLDDDRIGLIFPQHNRTFMAWPERRDLGGGMVFQRAYDAAEYLVDVHRRKW